MGEARTDDRFDKPVKEPTIDLEESAVIDAIVESCGVITERRIAPLGDGPWRLRWIAGFADELDAFERGDLFCEGFREFVEAAFCCCGGEEADEE